MPDHARDPIQRRGFLARLATGTAALTAALGGTRLLAQGAAPAGRPTPDGDKWLDALTGQHRQIYDVLSTGGASGLSYARNFLNANNEGYALADKDVSVAVSLRHLAVPMGFNDAVWEKYKIGEYLKFDDPKTKAPATHNIWAGRAGEGGTGSPSVTALAARGVVFPMCGMSFKFLTGELARTSGLSSDAVREELTAGMLPGTFLVVAGVIAVNRAQERGFSYVYAG